MAPRIHLATENAFKWFPRDVKVGGIAFLPIPISEYSAGLENIRELSNFSGLPSYPRALIKANINVPGSWDGTQNFQV